LETIGSESVVQELARRNVAGDWGMRIAVATTLEKIHSDFSVQTCLKLLAQETDASLQGHLLEAVLMNFCSDGIGPARQHVLTRAKSLEMLEVRSALLVACKLLGETFPEYLAWREDSKHDCKFRTQWYEDHPVIPIADGTDSDDSSETSDDILGQADDDAPTLTVVGRNGRISRIGHSDHDSGKEFQTRHWSKVNGAEKSDADHASVLGGIHSIVPTKRYPVGTVAFYGRDDRRITKIVAAVVKHERAGPILERWVGTTVCTNPKVRRQMKALFDRHKVATVVTTDGNIGCPHEEGMDFPRGEDCPFCPFWAGKQGRARRD
jgi:hypothetical protein